MKEKFSYREVFTRRNLLLFVRNLALTILIISPLLVFLGMMAFTQTTYPDEKAPFVQWSGYNPQKEAVVAWETDDKESSTVWYGSEKDDLNLKETDGDRVRIHRVVLTNLDPDTKYYYKVGKDGDDPIYRSSIQSFRTAPNSNSKKFDFLVYSDSQQFYGIGWHKRICDALSEHEDISFVAVAGDLCQNWDYKPDWNQYFEEGSVFLKNTPLVPCMGNHDGYYPEDDPKAEKHWYEQYFGATNTSSDPHTFYYAFNWSNVQFVVGEIADTGDENPEDPLNQKHDRWLNQTLAKGQDKTFRILMFHRQLFSAEEHNSDLIERIVPIVEKYNVSLVLYGHHHHYERFLYNDHTYICLGGGGGQQFGAYYFRPGEHSECFSVGPSYTKISVDADKMGIKTYSPEGDLIDESRISS